MFSLFYFAFDHDSYSSSTHCSVAFSSITHTCFPRPPTRISTVFMSPPASQSLLLISPSMCSKQGVLGLTFAGKLDVAAEREGQYSGWNREEGRQFPGAEEGWFRTCFGWCGLVWVGVGWCGLVCAGVGWCGLVWVGSDHGHSWIFTLMASRDKRIRGSSCSESASLRRHVNPRGQ